MAPDHVRPLVFVRPVDGCAGSLAARSDLEVPVPWPKTSEASLKVHRRNRVAPGPDVPSL